jgi:phosphatidylinositol 4-kinase type 2
VIKGQAWNIVQSLKHDVSVVSFEVVQSGSWLGYNRMKVNIWSLDFIRSLTKHLPGPLELTRRTKALVWNDELELDEDTISQIQHSSQSTSPQPSINTLPLPGTNRRSRSQSNSSDFPPPVRRVSSEQPGSMRPVPFSAKFQRVHPGTTGVTVLEHLERLDAVEASLERLAVEDGTEEIEEDVGESSSTPRPIMPASILSLSESALITSSSAPSRAGASELAPVPEADSPTPSMVIEEHEEDVVALSKSLSHLETGNLHHGRGLSSHSAQAANRTLDWMQDEPVKKRVVISEVWRTQEASLCIIIDVMAA